MMGRNSGHPPAVKRDVVVFVIDPFDDERSMYTEYFRSVGFTAHGFNTLPSAIKSAVEEPPDVVVAHLRQHHDPRGGIDVIRCFGTVAERRVPVVILTTSMTDDDCALVRKAGGSDCVLLPSPLEDLATELRSLAGGSKRG